MKWQTLAGPKHTYSAVAKNSNGRLELFALAEDGDIYHCWQLEAGYSDIWSQWRSLGGEWAAGTRSRVLPRSFAVCMSGRGCLELFVVADGTPPYAKGQIFHNKQTHLDEGEGTWTGWHGLDAKDTDGWSKDVGPTVVRNKDGFLDLFVMSADRGVLKEYWWSDYTSSTAVGHFSQTRDDTWSGPETRVSIETCVEVEGRTDYLCLSKLPVKLVSALNKEGRPELFASVGNLQAKRRGVQGLAHIPANLWHAWRGPGYVRNWWTGSLPMPPTKPGQPDAEYDSDAAQPLLIQGHDGTLELCMWDPANNDVWVRKQNTSISMEGDWSPWLSIGASQQWGHPAVVSNRDKLLSVFATSQTSGSIWYTAQHLDDHEEAVWSQEWRPIDNGGGDAQTQDSSGAELVHAIANQDGRIELFASGPDSVGFYHKYQARAGNWS